MRGHREIVERRHHHAADFAGATGVPPLVQHLQRLLGLHVEMLALGTLQRDRADLLGPVEVRERHAPADGADAPSAPLRSTTRSARAGTQSPAASPADRGGAPATRPIRCRSGAPRESPHAAHRPSRSLSARSAAGPSAQCKRAPARRGVRSSARESSSKSSASLSSMVPPSCSASTMVTARR
jgi:hypothetical protein